MNDSGIPDRALTRILAESLRAEGVLSFGFLDGPRLARTVRGLPVRISESYGLARARGAAVAALHYDTRGSPAGAMDAEYFRDGEGRPLAALGWFARAHWYRELSERLASASRAPGLGPAGSRSAFRIGVNSRLPEKALAVAAGLGPVGRNTLILERRAGPGCVLGVLVLPFQPDPAEGSCPPEPDRADPGRPGADCGTCDECVRACPTGAVLPGGGIVRTLCIQHWASVEDPVPGEVAGRWRGNLYGCDLCLAACPRFRPGFERGASAGPLGRGLEPSALLEAGEDELRARFRGTALGLSWIRPSLLKRNARLAAASWASIRFDFSRAEPVHSIPGGRVDMEGTTANQYLTFTLEGEQYAIGVAKVREVLEHTKITKLPRTAEFMKGIINLRGTGVPVIDLRLKFGMPETPVTKDTSIIVMEVEGLEGAVVVGALADAVHEVVEIDAGSIEPAPKFGTRLAAEFILGVGKREEGFVILLDIDKIFNSEDLNVLRTAETAEAAV